MRLLDTIVILSSVLPVIVALMLIRKIPAHYKFLAVIFFLAATTELLGFSRCLTNLQNTILQNLYTPLITLLFLLFFWYEGILWQVPARARLVIWGLAITLILLSSFYFEDVTLPSRFSWAINNIIMVVFALLSLYKLLQTPKYDFIQKESLFWLNISFLLAFGCTTFIFLVSPLAGDVNNPDTYIFIDYLLKIINIASYITASIGLWTANH
jgi:hypothetical protein